MIYNTKYAIEDKMKMVLDQENSGLVAKEWCVQNNIINGSLKNFSQDIKRYNETKKIKTDALKRKLF